MVRAAAQKHSSKAIRLALRPLVRLGLRYGVKLMDLVEILKSVYVEVAHEEIGEVASASKISVMTGVHRKDVVRLTKTDQPERKSGDIVSRVIGQWNTSRAFLSKSGTPRVLSFSGVESEFAELVRSVSNDVAPYTVLYELERTGRVTRTSRGLKLLSQLYVANSRNVEEGFAMLGEDSADLIAAVEQNMLQPAETPNLHLKTEFTRIDAKDASKVRRWILEQGSMFHKKVELYLRELDADTSPKRKAPTESVRVAFGSYGLVTKSPTSH